MKRTNILWLALDSLFLIVFNILFFMFIYPENNIDTVWVSYGFIHFSYALLLITPLLVRHNKADYIYRRPLFAINTTYFLLELAIGSAFILKGADYFALCVITQVILSAIFIASLLIHLIANEHTATNTQQHEIELQYVKASVLRINSILKQIQTTDKSTNKKIERLYDLIHSSPTKSNENVHSLEQKIVTEIGVLEHAIKQNESDKISIIADKIYSLAETRNQQLKSLDKR